MFCFFSTQEETAKRQQLLAEHYKSLPELGFPKPKQHLVKQHKVAFCSRRVFQAGHTIARMLFCIRCCNLGPAKKSPAGFLPTIQAESKCAGVGVLLYHLRLYVQRLVLAPVLRENCSISYTASRWALYGQEEPCLLNKQLFNILFSPHCSMCGLEPSPALNTEPVVSLQAF